MKEMWKKIDRFMLAHGIYALLVATIATGFFLAVLQWANDYMKEETKPLEISIDDQGYLSVNYQYDDKEKVYIMWETDGGNLTVSHDGSIFSQNEQGYYGYTGSDEKVIWNPKDPAGCEFENATVRATLYEKNEKNIYSPKNYVMDIQITLKMKDGIPVKTESRVFGNPKKSGVSEDWAEIYCIQDTEKSKTYRYRTGRKISDDEILILCWQAEHSILSQTDYSAGFYPECMSDDKTESDVFYAVDMVTIEKDKISGSEKITAFLIGEDAYKNKRTEKEARIGETDLVIN